MKHHPRTPRWLYNQQRSEEADKVMMKVAKWNGTTLPKPLVVTAQVCNSK